MIYIHNDDDDDDLKKIHKYLYQKWPNNCLTNFRFRCHIFVTVIIILSEMHVCRNGGSGLSQIKLGNFRSCPCRPSVFAFRFRSNRALIATIDGQFEMKNHWQSFFWYASYVSPDNGRNRFIFDYTLSSLSGLGFHMLHIHVNIRLIEKISIQFFFLHIFFFFFSETYALAHL
jgi:hypothetical protein